MSRYDYKGHAIVSSIIRSDVVPARLSVKVWRHGANHFHDVPVHFTTSLDKAMRWIDAQPAVPNVGATVIPRRVLPCFM
jgi:hypothetical protein